MMHRVFSRLVLVNGLTLAVVSRFHGRNHLWLKPVGAGEARALPGTADAVHPFGRRAGQRITGSHARSVR